MTTWWHAERLDAVLSALAQETPSSIADLGCGSGDLLARLVGLAGVERLIGLEPSRDLLERARRRLGPDRVELVQGSALDSGPALRGIDAAVMVEVIEHLDPRDLPALAAALFNQMAPRMAVLTTPNAEFNGLLGVPSGRFRHPDHRFEWTRAQFRQWAEAVADRHRYDVALYDIAGRHPDLGGASQMAVFIRARR